MCQAVCPIDVRKWRRKKKKEEEENWKSIYRKKKEERKNYINMTICEEKKRKHRKTHSIKRRRKLVAVAAKKKIEKKKAYMAWKQVKWRKKENSVNNVAKYEKWKKEKTWKENERVKWKYLACNMKKRKKMKHTAYLKAGRYLEDVWNISGRKNLLCYLRGRRGREDAASYSYTEMMKEKEYMPLCTPAAMPEGRKNEVNEGRKGRKKKEGRRKEAPLFCLYIWKALYLEEVCMKKKEGKICQVLFICLLYLEEEKRAWNVLIVWKIILYISEHQMCLICRKTSFHSSPAF